MEKSPKKHTPAEAKAKLYRYCAYQERSHQEVKDKLYSLGLHRSDVDDIVMQLITEGFLNEERFARAFAGGKFRMQHWGRIKIQHELEARGLTANCIRAGLKEIDEQDYLRTLIDLLTKKDAQLTDDDMFVRRDKLARYMIQKGFEPELVWREIRARLR